MKTMTIGIPVFNQAEFVKEAIESALNQTVPCEIIVVNDGSTDTSKFEIEDYRDRVKIIHQVNKGLAAARNTAIMNATGDYFLPLDADDVLEPNCVEEIQKVIEDTDADVVAPSFKQFGISDALVLLMMRPSLDDFKTGNRIGYCAAIKRSALLECGGYSPRMTWGYEDYHLWFDLLLRNKKFVTIPDYLWNYRTKKFSMMNVAQAHNDQLIAQIHKDFPGLV